MVEPVGGLYHRFLVEMLDEEAMSDDSNADILRCETTENCGRALDWLEISEEMALSYSESVELFVATRIIELPLGESVGDILREVRFGNAAPLCRHRSQTFVKVCTYAIEVDTEDEFRFTHA